MTRLAKGKVVIKLLKTSLFFSLLPIPLAEVQAQEFVRTELPTEFNNPWEMTYGADGFLWLTEWGGVVSRVHPETGAKQTVFTATDFFEGSTLEQSAFCDGTHIGAGTLGLALDPDFTEEAHSYIYFVYSYNSGTEEAPATKFKVVRLEWDAATETVASHSDLITDIPTGYDHLGGRLMAIKREGVGYLFLTVGDNGISEDNNPDCYNPQSTNPNNFTQDPTTKNGKIHRFLLDGSIPTDNPIEGNSFYTRGHRNPQGLMYNPDLDILYGIEHGDQTDDEINVLEAGMNYGWKQVRGYHNDDNHEGELDFVNNYVAHPDIAGDALMEPLYSWCQEMPDGGGSWANWCTVAPSDGIFYGSNGIPEWENSLLVVTLKDGDVTDKEVYQFRLTPDGKSVQVTAGEDPNPRKFFGEDQNSNGRLRDIAVSPDGKKIFLINNGGNGLPNKIKVYTYKDLSIEANGIATFDLYPNPSTGIVHITSDKDMERIEVYNTTGAILKSFDGKEQHIDIQELASGMYHVKVYWKSGESSIQKISKY